MSKRNWFGVGAVVAVVLSAGGVLAGNLTPPGPPGATMYSLEDIYLAVTGDSNVVNTTSGDAVAGEILNGKKAWVKGQEVTGTMPNVGQTNIVPGTAAQTIPMGYHDGTGAVSGDAGLVAENIRKDAEIFGVAGTFEGGSAYPAPVPKTGQTTSYATGDDGDLEKGVAWPSPRFTVQADTNCVTDNLTGLVWARNANLGGLMTWATAITYCEGLTHGGTNDWRLPNIRELQSLVDVGHSNPALPSGHPFTGVQSDSYWSSCTTYAASYAWHVGLHRGGVYFNTKTTTCYVWPVRGGQ